MKVVRIIGDGKLAVTEAAKPQPKSGEALVRIHAAGLNRADLLQRRGKYPPPPDAPADIPGLEFAGVVESIGDASATHAGQRVFGLCGGGAQSEYIAISDLLLVAIPEPLSDIEAAAIPEVYVTAHDALITQARLQPAERLLIHAIGSGVGLAALQIAKALGCQVFGTSRSKAKLVRVKALGADIACLPDAFDEAIRRATDGKGVDVILDPVGAAYFEKNLNLLAPGGRIIFISTMGGADTQLSLAVLMRKRLRLFGTHLRARSLQEKASAIAAFSRDVLPKLARGELKVVIDRVFPIDKAAEAYEYMEQNKNVGKIVLTL